MTTENSCERQGETVLIWSRLHTVAWGIVDASITSIKKLSENSKKKKNIL